MKTSLFDFKKSNMSLTKVADRCASSPTNRITPSPECRASHYWYMKAEQSLFSLALWHLRYSRLCRSCAQLALRISCLISLCSSRGFLSKRQNACSLIFFISFHKIIHSSEQSKKFEKIFTTTFILQCPACVSFLHRPRQNNGVK